VGAAKRAEPLLLLALNVSPHHAPPPTIFYQMTAALSEYNL